MNEAQEPVGVVDIGSNSVRLVVFDDLRRHPQVLFNEKVLCGLGSAVGRTGLMDDGAMDLAVATLRRFRLLLDHMKVAHRFVLGTAAVREAKNGHAFVVRVAGETGLKVEVIDGVEEARLSALGVIAGLPEARGVVGDLGGGSLELVEVADGAAGRGVSLPIGPVRLAGIYGDDMESIAAEVKAQLQGVPWLGRRADEEFYVVGGAWRAVSRINMVQEDAPLPILHGFALRGVRARTLAKLISRQHPESLRGIEGVSERRIVHLPLAALVLQQILWHMRPVRVVTSALGLREGLIYDRLDPHLREQDPFLEAVRERAGQVSRFPGQGERLIAWIEPLFDGSDETAKERHLRHAVCLLSDISWRGHPDFRAERAVTEALYGRYVGIDHFGRGFIGLALNRLYGASDSTPLATLCRSLLDETSARRAQVVGAALRLGQRLSGGIPDLLGRCRLIRSNGGIELAVDSGLEDLVNEVVERRLSALAKLLGENGSVSYAHAAE